MITSVLENAEQNVDYYIFLKTLSFLTMVLRLFVYTLRTTLPASFPMPWSSSSNSSVSVSVARPPLRLALPDAAAAVAAAVPPNRRRGPAQRARECLDVAFCCCRWYRGSRS